MIKNRLGQSQYLVSKIALGTVQFGLNYGFNKKKSQYEVDEILDCATHNGLNLIDTAREYGDSEEKIGSYIARHKNDFIIATKLKKITKKEVKDNLLKDEILRSVDSSLENLNLTSLDILQLHQADDYLVHKDMLWNTIYDLKNKNILNSFGVSVYDTKEALALICKYGDLIDFFQVPYNIFDRRFEKLEALLTKNSISLLSRSTFLKGIIPCALSELPPELAEIKPYKKQLQEQAFKLDMSVSELAMLFVYCSEHIQSMLVGVNSPEELVHNINTISKYDCSALRDVDFKKVIIDRKQLIDPRKWKNF